LRLSPMRAGAGGARTLVAQVAETVFAMMAVFPIDLNTLRLGNGDVFGFRCAHSLVRYPGRRRCAGWPRPRAPAVFYLSLLTSCPPARLRPRVRRRRAFPGSGYWSAR